QDRQEVAGEAHAFRIASLVGPPTETGSAAKTQGLSKPSDRILTPAAASRTAPLWCAARAETAGSMASTWQTAQERVGSEARGQGWRQPVHLAVQVLGGQVSGGQPAHKAVSTDHKKPRGTA